MLSSTRCCRHRLAPGLLMVLAGPLAAAPAQDALVRGLTLWQLGTADAMDEAERTLYHELQGWSGRSLDAGERALLERLTTLPVRATEAHPEVPALRQPRFPVAARAQGLLEQDSTRQTAARSAALLGDPARWLAAYRDAERPQDWQLALEGRRLPATLAAELERCAGTARCAEALLAQGKAISPTQFRAAAASAAPAALVRVVATLDAAAPVQREVLEQAQAVPATAALATHRLQQHGAPDLSLLGDVERGAALASALSVRLDPTMIDTLARRYAVSDSVLEQQRLLLVLHLNGSATAQAALATWLDSAATLPQTREAARSW